MSCEQKLNNSVRHAITLFKDEEPQNHFESGQV